jgi:hypothetical protein
LSAFCFWHSGWKNKARKFKLPKNSQKCKIDQSKLQILVGEGNNIAFTSRLKDIFKTGLEAVNVEAADEGPDRKRSRLSGSTMTRPTAFAILSEDFPCSSDEETAFELLSVDDPRANENLFFKFSYPEDVESRLGSAPVDLWPPKLTIPRKLISLQQ